MSTISQRARSRWHGMRAAIVAALAGWSVVSARALDARHSDTLLAMCDALVATQITDPAAPDCGALVCPSVNPQVHPLHSRAAEAVYPFAIAYQQTHRARYRDAAVLLARWLAGKQQPRGAWGEAWPKYDGWTGTTADQLISLAGAYPILRDELSAADRVLWEHAMRQAVDFVVATFPAGNINYQPTGAVGLLLAAEALREPAPVWRSKADALIGLTLAAVNRDDLLTGEGGGVDLGYNLAQSVGYLALYGILKSDPAITRRAAELLRAHAWFVYPNGAVDNSWGTRSYKWTYESGTKTAPGVYFTFALLADADPAFGPLGDRCFDYLNRRALEHGLVIEGPHADQHASLTPPCLYSTFARAQSLALAIAYAPKTAAPKRGPTAEPTVPWVRYFPTVKVALVRTAKYMATVSAYGAIARYGRGQVTRGGSITNLWYDGFGADGFAQTSSVTIYRREEDIHMPNEPALRPLTARAECTIDGVYYTNLFEAAAKIDVKQTPAAIEVTTTGELRDASGKSSGVQYRLVHRFLPERIIKEWTLTSPRTDVVRLVEPFVRDTDLVVTDLGGHAVMLRHGNRDHWRFVVTRSPEDTEMTAGESSADYWNPFPAVNAYPLVVTVQTAAGAPTVATTEFGPLVASP